MKITPSVKEIIKQFGEMGNCWGMTKTVGQIYGLLFLQNKPICADDIASALKISRGNVSMSIKELSEWDLVISTKQSGDRKTYYQCQGKLKDMAKKVFYERRVRELKPALTILDKFTNQANQEMQNEYAIERVHELHQLVQSIDDWADNFVSR